MAGNPRQKSTRNEGSSYIDRAFLGGFLLRSAFGVGVSLCHLEEIHKRKKKFESLRRRNFRKKISSPRCCSNKNGEPTEDRTVLRSGGWQIEFEVTNCDLKVISYLFISGYIFFGLLLAVLAGRKVQ